MEENLEALKKAKLNKTWLLVAGLVILTGVLLVISLTSRNPSSLPSGAGQIKTDFAHTSLSLSDAPRVSSVSGVYEEDININSKDNTVTGAQLELSYDPRALTNVNVRPGSFISSPLVILKRIDTKTGRISFVVETQLGKPGKKGSGTIAVISFVKTGAQSTPINFLPQTLVKAYGYDQSVLQQTTSTVINLVPKTSSGGAQSFVSPLPSVVE